MPKRASLFFPFVGVAKKFYKNDARTAIVGRFERGILVIAIVLKTF
jgi:hypothetical protein